MTATAAPSAPSSEVKREHTEAATSSIRLTPFVRHHVVAGRTPPSSRTFRRDETDAVGLLVVSDAARGAIDRNRASQRVNGYAVASKPALTLPPDMLTRSATGLLVRFQVSRSVVVDRDRNPIEFVSPQGLVISRQPPRPGPTVAARNTLASMGFGGGGTDSRSGPDETRRTGYAGGCCIECVSCAAHAPGLGYCDI